MGNINDTKEYLSTLSELENQVTAINDLLSRALQNATKVQDLSPDIFWTNQVSARLTNLSRDINRMQDKVKALNLVKPKDTDLENNRR